MACDEGIMPRVRKHFEAREIDKVCKFRDAILSFLWDEVDV